MVVTIVQNLALLTSLVVVYQLISRRLEAETIGARLLSGLLFGLVGIAGMTIPFVFAPGIVFDGRSIILGVAGFFGGPVVAVIAALVCALYRFWLGGVGAFVGVSVIALSAGVGVAFYYLRQRDPRTTQPLALWLFGLLLHIGMLGLIYQLPGDLGPRAVSTIGPPVLLLYPVATMLICWILLNEENRLETERKLHESEERYRMLFENNHAPMLLLDPIDGAVRDANPTAAAYYGWSREEIRKMSVNDFTEKTTEHPEPSKSPPTPPGEGHFFSRHLRADGMMRDVEIYTSSIRLKEGEVLYSIVFDTTDRREAETRVKKLETELFQAQKLDAIGRLAGGIAHDFNNMLSVINGYTELAMAELGQDNPIQEHLETIKNAGKRSTNLTRQLLGFARKQEVVPKILDVNKTIQKMLGILGHLIGEDIKLTWRPSDKPVLIILDPTQLDQILANLVINARDAISETGEIVIQTGIVKVGKPLIDANGGTGDPGDYATLSVRDTGKGMDRITLSHIFEPFFTTKSTGNATGLGLATVHGIVSQNNGFIDVQTELGEGSVFTIYLPESKDRRTVPEAKAETPRKRLSDNRGTVLIAEDEKAILTLSTSFLEKSGFTVLPAESPADAIRLAEEFSGKIDLLVTDVVMPEMNGRELWQRLNAMRPGLPCLYVSGYTAEIIAKRGIVFDDVHFLHKPFSRAELLREVNEALAKYPETA